MGFIDNRDAQFMLLAGFIIAVGLVITTVMINSIIFESNLAIDSVNDPSKTEIVNLMEITRDEVRSAYRNATNSSGVTVSNQTLFFNSQMQIFGANIPKIYAKYGEGVNVTYPVEGWNNTPYANFTKNGTSGGASNWTVVENVNNVTVFALELLNTNGVFLINVTNSSGRIWSMNISSSQINVINKTGGVSSYGSESNIYIYTNSTYEFNDSTSGETYSIHFVNADSAWGRYKIQGQHATYNNQFTRERHYVLNATVALSTSRIRANITIPVTVPW